METLKTLIRQCRKNKSKIAVVGDLLIDEYYQVSADKISPEFPIIRMLSDSDQPNIVVPGGGGNLAHQLICHFNVDLNIIGFINQYGKGVYKKVGINTDNCVCVPHIPVKRRFYQDQFPLSRWDIESFEYGLGENITKERERLVKKYQSIPEPEVVIFADYNKGVFSSSDNWMQYYPDAIKIVDPKVKPIERWKGCTVFKPNKKEAQELSGIPADQWHQQCDFFQRVLGCIAVVITLDGSGICGKIMDRYFDYHSPYSTVCESVIGAGDCFASILGLAMSHSVDILEGVKIAYEGAAVYVGKKHNEPVTLYEILGRFNPSEAKFVDVDYLKKRNFKLSSTNGCFDLMHVAHMEILKFAKSQGGKLLVLIDTDKHVTQLKGMGRPVNNLNDRMRMLAALDCVDFVIPFNSDEELHQIYSEIKPDVLVKDDSWDHIVGSDVAQKTLIFPRIKGYATTNVVDKIKAS
jgi:D-beta-D-heptose 7-phosphate kinase/D-beta-D-heptose 1-phosphate adenosyltransferase